MLTLIGTCGTDLKRPHFAAARRDFGEIAARPPARSRTISARRVSRRRAAMGAAHGAPELPAQEAYQIGKWRVEPDLDELRHGERIVKLEPRAMRLLVYLIKNPGRAIPVRELLEQLWPDVVVGVDSVYQAIALLRRVLGDHSENPSYIALIPRKGYRLIAPARPIDPANVAPPVFPPAAAAAIPGPRDIDVPAATFPATSAHVPGRRRIRALLTALIVVAGVAVTIRVSTMLATAPEVAPRPKLASAPAEALPAGEGEAPRQSSVAILPFLDLTEKRDLGYFADGMTEELIAIVSRSPGVRVPARTSSFYFKDKNVKLAEIARDINVANVLEGSVRRSGDRIRVTVQLIRADNGFHLWAQDFDRDLTDVFGIEDEIARAVASTLRIKLPVDRLGEGAGPADVEAHNLVLQCQFHIRRNTAVDADQAVKCFEGVVKRFPRHALAWSGLADAIFRQPSLTEGSIAERRAAARRALVAAREALRLRPDLPAAHAIVAHIAIRIDRDWQAADAELHAALASDPDDPSSLLTAGALARDLGRFDEAIALWLRAAVRDPLNFLPYARLGLLYAHLNRLPEAEAAVRKRIDLAPESEGGYTQLADVLLMRGRPTAALKVVGQETNAEERLIGYALCHAALGRIAEADAELAELTRSFGRRNPTEVAEVYAYRGLVDQAFALIDQAVELGDPDILAIKADRYFKPMHADPRYTKVLRSMNLPD